MPGNNPTMNPFAMSAAWTNIRAIILSAIEVVGRLAIGFAPTRRIESAIFHGVDLESDNKISVYVGADIQKAPEAAAYEFGSGLLATRGPRSKYPIESTRPGGHLAFLWENEPANMRDAPHLPDGRIVLDRVMHPGVAAKPYLEPAFDSEAKEKVVEAIYLAMDSAIGAGPDEIKITSEVLVL